MFSVHGCHSSSHFLMNSFTISLCIQYKSYSPWNDGSIQGIKIENECINFSRIKPPLLATLSTLDLPVPTSSDPINRPPRCILRPHFPHPKPLSNSPSSASNCSPEFAWAAGSDDECVTDSEPLTLLFFPWNLAYRTNLLTFRLGLNCSRSTTCATGCSPRGLLDSDELLSPVQEAIDASDSSMRFTSSFSTSFVHSLKPGTFFCNSGETPAT